MPPNAPARTPERRLPFASLGESSPLPLSLTAADELTVLDHLHVFKRNGFEIQAVEGA